MGHIMVNWVSLVQRSESISSSFWRNRGLELAVVWVRLAMRLLRLALRLAIGSPTTCQCRIYGSPMYKSLEIQLSGKCNCKRVGARERCTTVALRLAVGSLMSSHEVTVEQNLENPLVWNCNCSTFTVSSLYPYGYP